MQSLRVVIFIKRTAFRKVIYSDEYLGFYTNWYTMTTYCSKNDSMLLL